MSVRISSYLRRVILVDAAISGATGLLLLIAAGALARLLHVPELLLRTSGLILIPFVAFLLWIARHEEVSRLVILSVIGLNTAWVAASVWLVLGSAIEPNTFGVGFIVVQAIAVAAFAEFQYVGLRRAAVS